VSLLQLLTNLSCVYVSLRRSVVRVPLQVELQVTSIRVVSRAAALPFELVDAARSDVSSDAAAAMQRQQVQQHTCGLYSL
jgi:hypothetical protein